HSTRPRALAGRDAPDTGQAGPAVRMGGTAVLRTGTRTAPDWTGPGRCPGPALGAFPWTAGAESDRQGLVSLGDRPDHPQPPFRRPPAGRAGGDGRIAAGACVAAAGASGCG